MASSESISEMLVELGPLIDAAGIWWDADQESWTIALDEATVLTALADSESRTLMLEADVGPIAGAETDVRPRLLAFNDHGTNDHGIWMSLDDTGAMAVQVMTIGLDGMTSHTLKAGIEAFGAQLREWREIIPPAPVPDEVVDAETAEGDASSRADEAPPPDLPLGPGIVRG